MNCTIAAAYKTALEKSKTVHVYNSSTGSVNPINWGQLFDYVEEYAQKYPYGKFLILKIMNFHDFNFR